MITMAMLKYFLHGFLKIGNNQMLSVLMQKAQKVLESFLEAETTWWNKEFRMESLSWLSPDYVAISPKADHFG